MRARLAHRKSSDNAIFRSVLTLIINVPGFDPMRAEINSRKCQGKVKFSLCMP